MNPEQRVTGSPSPSSGFPDPRVIRGQSDGLDRPFPVLSPTMLVVTGIYFCPPARNRAVTTTMVVVMATRIIPANYVGKDVFHHTQWSRPDGRDALLGMRGWSSRVAC